MPNFSPMPRKPARTGKSNIMKKARREFQTTQTLMQRLPSLMSDVSCNVNELGSQPTNMYPSKDRNVQHSGVVRTRGSTASEKRIEGSRPAQFKAMRRMVHKGTNVHRETKYNACPSRVKERSNPNQGHASIAVKDSIKNPDSTKGKEFSPRIFGKDLSNSPRKNTSSMDDRKCRSVSINSKSSNMGQEVNCTGKRNNGKRMRGSLLDENKTNVDHNKGVQLDNQICGQTKKQRLDDDDDDDEEEANNRIGDHNRKNFEDTSRWMSKASKVSIPLHIEGQSCCSRPIGEPTWRGIFKIGKNYVSLAGHLSTKYSEKVWKLSRSLMPLVEVTKLSRSEAWPKGWEASKPNDNNIGLYFFPHEMRPNANLDQLLKEVMDNDLALRAIVGEVEMLIFPSILLPEPYKTFKGKYYLWGVFKPREHKSVAVAKGLNTIRCYVHQDELQCEEQDQEAILMKSTTTLENQNFPDKIVYEVQATNAQGTPNSDFETKAHEEGRQGVHHTMCTSEDVANATKGDTLHANQGQIDPSRGPPSGKVFVGFIAGQTPRLLQLIQEMECEGGVVIAMQGRALSLGKE